MSTSGARSILVSISELRLEMSGPLRADLLAAAIEDELTRLFAGQELPASLLRTHQVSQLDGGRLDGPIATSTRRVGSAIARRIYHGLARGGGG
ncbi:MAG: hypothetical protein JOZ81_17550 [Chloroflexi bacterium]|nr:hypothetical protein [Chloroflexota bacterium]MBV9596855.1 hypothetical protein [Chloroflexota bacterium]